MKTLLRKWLGIKEMEEVFFIESKAVAKTFDNFEQELDKIDAVLNYVSTKLDDLTPKPKPAAPKSKRPKRK